MEPTPLQVNSNTHLLYKAQDPSSACRLRPRSKNNFLSETILMKEQSLLHRSRSSGRDLLGGTNSFAGQFLHPSPVQSSRSIQHIQTVLGPKHFSISSNFDERPVFASQIIRNSGRDLLGGTNSFAGQLLHPSPKQSSRPIQRMQTETQVQNSFLSEAILMKEQSLLHRSRNSERDLLGGTNSFAGQLLHPSSVQSSRSIQHMQTVPSPNSFSL